MIIVPKFYVNLTPDTLQSAYMKYEDIDVDVEIKNFSDGSICVILPNLPEHSEHRYCVVNAHIQSMDDLMIAAQIIDVLRRKYGYTKSITLSLSSTLYSRYDRVMLGNDSFGLSVFAKFVNVIGASIVIFLDVHSDVMTTHVQSSVNVSQHDLAKSMIDLSQYNIIAPDAGALAKIDNPDIIFNKVRDLNNGNIIGMGIDLFEPKDGVDKYLILDDICEGGRTFIECAKLMNDRGINKGLELYVTHGLFTNNAITRLLQYYDHIYTYIICESVYNTLSKDEQEKLTVGFLVEA